MPFVRLGKQKRRGVLLGQHALLALRFGKQGGKALEPRRKLDRRRVRAARRAIKQHLIALLGRQEACVVECDVSQFAHGKRRRDKRCVALLVVERVEKRDDICRLLSRKRVIERKEYPRVVRIFLDRTKEIVECFRRSSLHRLNLAERKADERKHLQGIVRTQRSGRLLPARHAASEHLLRQQAVTLLPCQKPKFHGEFREIGVLLHRLLQDGHKFFFRPLLSEKRAHESPIFRAFASHVDDLARNRLPRILDRLREIAQAIITIHIMQGVIHRFSLCLFLLAQELEIAFQLLAHDVL